MTARQRAADSRAWQGIRQGTPRQTAILQFPLPLIVTEPPPRCLWCRAEFAPSKPNQLYCKPKHRQYACDCRKARLEATLADFLEGHGASPQRAQSAALGMIEGYYASGRIQGVVARCGWIYDEVGRSWRVPA